MIPLFLICNQEA